MAMYLHLGGTLFVSALHKNLTSIANGEKYENLKSVVIDTEDSLAQSDLKNALEILQIFLKSFVKKKVLVFIRARNVELLEQILSFDGISKIDGFVLPKFSLHNADNYLALLQNQDFLFMPSIEGEELFDTQKLLELRTKLLPFQKKIILIRFGLEDMLRQLKMRRTCEDSIFDFSVTNVVLGNFIAVFKSAGFEVSGGVYPCFNDKDGFLRDIKRDLHEGLFSKTIIHPNQIEPMNELYKVTLQELEEAQKIVDFEGEVTALYAKMLEKKTMLPHAQAIILRSQIYGFKN